MPWPTPQEYNEAIQHPALCFADADLQAGTPDLTVLGLPRPITGNFASVYRVRASHDWAVRCFFREYADSRDRYAAISTHLASARLPYTVGFEYLQRGIRVGSSWFPILKMQWIEGTLLGDYVAAHRHDPAALRDLSERWLDMLGQLERRSIAHGDLQHGNVLVVGGELRLVDYDWMFVPALGGRISHEVGHPNYQHPARTGQHFGSYLDRFSGWVIYLSLLALQRCPVLWDELAAGDECLLFRRADLACPQQSVVLGRLRSEPDLRPIGEQAERMLSLPPTRVPPVTSLDSPRRSASARPAGTQSSLPVWLEDMIPPPPLRRFAWPPVLPRLVALVTAVMMAAVYLAEGLPAAVGGAAAILVELGAVWLAYMSDPAVAERTILAAHRFLVSVRLLWLALATYASNRHVRWSERRHAAARRRLERRRNVVDADYQRCGETINQLFAPQLGRVSAELAAVRAGRKTTEEAILQAVRERSVERRLRRSRLLTSRIEGLSWRARPGLWLAGVRTAHHVSGHRVDALQRLQPSQAAAVLRWRVSIERQIRQGAGPELPTHIRRLLDCEYGRVTAGLERRRESEEGRAARLLSRASAVRDHELRRLDRRTSEATRRRDAALEWHDRTMASLEARRGRLWIEIDAVDERLDILRHLTFRRYLFGVIGLDRATGSRRRSDQGA